MFELRCLTVILNMWVWDTVYGKTEENTKSLLSLLHDYQMIIITEDVIAAGVLVHGDITLKRV